MTVLEYDKVVRRLSELMATSSLKASETTELEAILDSIDEYNSLEYLKAREN